MTSIDRIRLYHYQLPLNYPIPLKGSRLTARQGFIIEVILDGRYGYGEAAPLADFSHESVEEAGRQLMQVSESLLSSGAWSETLPDSLYPSVRFALSSVLWMLEQPQWLPVLEQAPLLQGDTESILQRLRNWSSSWPAEFKLKIGKGTLGEDVQRIQQVIKVLPDSTKLRLDANQRWSLEQALHVGYSLDPKRIAYIEEPTVNASEFTEIYQATRIPFALDETLQSRDYSYQKLDGLGAMVIKPTLVGGIDRCQELVLAAQSDGIRTVVSSAYESSVGIRILQQLSVQWAEEEHPGLDTVSAFSCPLVTDFHQPGQEWSFNSDLFLSTYYYNE
ncbi:o-succinylbenzoate synthase [Endozoicomonas sp. (ex Bugula neritina AB1)]|nr:o-succinylbenzoate synthase [Endozoicomonas sp. (ex Bugula neritina AB1)]